MAPLIYLVRHAEGQHNVARQHERDPDLTERGHNQCMKLQETFPSMERVAHIVSSPLRRCIRTSLQAFAPAMTRVQRVVLMPQIQETGSPLSSYGSSLESLQAAFGDIVDMTLMDDNWTDKSDSSKYAAEKAKTQERAREARVWIRDLARRCDDEDVIVVMTHCVMGHFLAQDFAYMGYGFANAKYRTYQFRDLDGDDEDALLYETESSPGLAGQWNLKR